MAGFRMGEGVLRRKPIEHIEDTEAGEGTGLRRTLGLWQLTAIGVDPHPSATGATTHAP
ncbi:hypothetical protein [Streptomyces sp. NPDC058812]|uniref:hypothetical protein n=1 Tax=unclassified Streptomyces TaxID=2593676 RepID=UPI003676097E